jgi:predicted AAA+ superfamily ATPase
LVDRVLAELVAGVSAVSVIGPRASGKTTTARRYARTVLQLDRPEEADVVQANPDAALRGLAEPVLIDEWQEAPAVLGAVKRSVDDDPRPGRYLLTGSVRAELDSQTWPGTGRVIHVPMTGLAVREQLGDPAAEPFIDRVARSGASDLRVPPEPPDIRDYLDLALVGGFPEPALRLPANLRQNWYDSYLQQLLTRDATATASHRDPVRLRRYFEALALNTAGVVESRTVYEAAGINRKTADAYDSLLQNLFVVEVVPAWFTNRLKRLVRTPKRYVVDPALAAAAARAEASGVMRDADLLGRLLDTFVAAQLRAELPVAAGRPRLYHVREQGGRREVDLLVELAGHRVIAIEIKASASPRIDSARHLAWLRDEFGDRFVHGLVLHAGRYTYELTDRITAVPICTLWS